ncbi:MAG: hypothetical protein AB7U61_14970 [Methylocystis sp.]
MTKDPKKGQADRLAQMDRFFIDDLLATSDKALLEEAAEDGVDIKETVKKGHEAFDRAQQAVGKSKLEAIRKAMAQDNGRKVVPIDRDRAQREIEAILKGNRNALSKLTMAARNQEGNDHDDDSEGLLEDFIELGVIRSDEPGANEK